jgi:hypothetical protein
MMSESTNHIISADLADDPQLVLAAEECRPDQFSHIHKFSEHDNRVIRKLMAHGPVLLQGGRGSGKSAFMIATSHRLAPHNNSSSVLGLYISLRYVPLLTSSGSDYERLFCKWVSSRIQAIMSNSSIDFSETESLRDLKAELSRLAATLEKRIVLFFDDAAHIGRETSLSTFFDIFRTISSDTISCKAAIYPGVTEFGPRFDVYNDATVVDIVRTPGQAGFSSLFSDILAIRYPKIADSRTIDFSTEQLASFIATAVLGNMRAFIFFCNSLSEQISADERIGMPQLTATLLGLAAGYYWPLLEEVKPKLGRYTPAVETSEEIANILLRDCATSSDSSSVLVHRKIVSRFSKPFEILEYAGFIARREASRAMKSGGRGSRVAMNLCNLLEIKSGARLTREIFNAWISPEARFSEIHEKGEHFTDVQVPLPATSEELSILGYGIDTLRKSRAYPYGLTDLKIERLMAAGIQTIGELASASTEDLLQIESIGSVFVDRIRSVVAQAVWM